MKLKILILVLVMLSLLLSAQRAIADPIEIVAPPKNIKVYAFEQVLDRWGDKQWTYLSALMDKENRDWDNEAQNPNSTAYGLGQFLDSTWEIVGCKKTKDQYVQMDCMLKYIELRYGTPQKALLFHKKNNWY
jgi:hypothetical protein